jgi:hypothetical protein
VAGGHIVFYLELKIDFQQQAAEKQRKISDCAAYCKGRSGARRQSATICPAQLGVFA